MQPIQYLNEPILQQIVPTRFGIMECAPDATMRPAVQDGYTLFGILDGRGALVKGGKTFAASAGDVWVVAPFADVRLRAESEPMTAIEIGFTASGDVAAILPDTVVHCDETVRIFSEMQRADEMQSGKTAFLTAKLWEWIAAVQEQAPAPTAEKADAVDTALEMIHTQFAQNLTVIKLSTMVGLDRSYFYTLFRKRTGESPQEYLVGYRLDKAAELIKEHGKSPSAAANAVGYTDLCQFSKMFKRRFGMSPRAYKNGGVSPAAASAPAPTRIWGDEPDVVLL